MCDARSIRESDRPCACGERFPAVMWLFPLCRLNEIRHAELERSRLWEMAMDFLDSAKLRRLPKWGDEGH